MSATIEITRKSPDPKSWTLVELREAATDWPTRQPAMKAGGARGDTAAVDAFLEWLGKEQA